MYILFWEGSFYNHSKPFIIKMSLGDQCFGSAVVIFALTEIAV